MHMREAFAEAAGKLAVCYLEGSGFRVLERNWRSGDDTLSIIAAQGDVVVAIDLRVNAGTRRTGPVSEITLDRAHMLRELAARWIVEHGRTASHVRIDVVALHQQGSGFVIEHARAVG